MNDRQAERHPSWLQIRTIGDLRTFLTNAAYYRDCLALADKRYSTALDYEQAPWPIILVDTPTVLQPDERAWIEKLERERRMSHRDATEPKPPFG